MVRDFVQENPGVSDAYLKGNIGTSQDIQSSILAPPPPDILSDPNGVVVAQAEVVGGDPIGVPLTVTVRARVDAGTLVDGEALKGTVEWGSGGFQPAAADFDLRHSQVIGVQGSWVRVKVINSTKEVINLAAFISIGSRTPGTDPILTNTFVLGIGATTDFPIPSFAKWAQVFTSNPTIDTYDVLFRVGGINIYSARILPTVNGSERISTSSVADVVRISNLGGAIIQRGVVFFGMQL